jgi:hypothetical protein
LIGSLYLAIIMDRYRRPKTALAIYMRGGLYIAIIMDRYGVTKTALTMASMEASTLPL